MYSVEEHLPSSMHEALDLILSNLSPANNLRSLFYKLEELE